MDVEQTIWQAECVRCYIASKPKADLYQVERWTADHYIVSPAPDQCFVQLIRTDTCVPSADDISRWTTLYHPKR